MSQRTREVVEKLANDPASFTDSPDRMDHIYALFLLAQFREKRLFPHLIALLHAPIDILNLVLSDLLADGPGRIAASVFNGDLDALIQLLDDEQLDEDIRGQAALALVALALEGTLEREAVLDILGTRLKNGLNPKFFTF